MESLAPAILKFWFGEGAERGKRHKRWFEKDPAFDAEVRQKFLPAYEEIRLHNAGLDPAAACLARILALDQFPRHMFRGTPRAFSTDALALAAAKHAVRGGYDLKMLPVERLFVYLPFEHSESLADQLEACELTAALEAFGETNDAHRYAIAHRDIIRRFGRFPHRNAALGRESTPDEIEFLKQPGSGF